MTKKLGRGGMGKEKKVSLLIPPEQLQLLHV